MPKKEKKRRGAPKGNLNALNQGFYARVLDEAEMLAMEAASGVDGIDDEIALLRVKIKTVLERDPENIKLIMQATNTLARLVKTRYNITSEQGKGLKVAMGNVLREIGVPIGINIGSNLIGD